VSNQICSPSDFVTQFRLPSRQRGIRAQVYLASREPSHASKTSSATEALALQCYLREVSGQASPALPVASFSRLGLRQKKHLGQGVSAVGQAQLGMERALRA